MTELVGFNARESSALLDLLQGRIVRLENTVRWNWWRGDLAISDNRSTQNYMVADWGDEVLEVRRVAVEGEVPEAIDGRRSRVVEGEPSRPDNVVWLANS